MPQPLVLDLFSGAGGAAQGYHLAGFDIAGIDTDPKMLRYYPFPSRCCDWRDGLASLCHHPLLALIHASPPCQHYTLAASPGRRAQDTRDWLPEVRQALRATGIPYIIESVPQAPLLCPVTLCGTTFGLPVIRHRSFECSFPVTAPPPCGYRPTARRRHEGYKAYPYARKSWEAGWRRHVIPRVWPWMDVMRSGQAIPPAYTYYLGRQFLAAHGMV